MELWDLYDCDRHPTGETHQRGLPMPKGRYHTVVHILIFNTKGELLIQQRQSYKEGWPNLWDLTVGGSAIAGDTSRTAAEREVMEELGLAIDLSHVQPTMILPFDEGFSDIYTLVMDVDLSTLHLQESEVQAVKWASEDEVYTLMSEGRFMPYYKELIQLLFAMKTAHGAHVPKK